LTLVGIIFQSNFANILLVNAIGIFID